MHSFWSSYTKHLLIRFVVSDGTFRGGEVEQHGCVRNAMTRALGDGGAACPFDCR